MKLHALSLTALALLLLGPSRLQAQVVRTPYLQSVAPDRVTVVWRTNTSIPTDSRVRYGTTQGNLTSTAFGTAGTPASNGGVRDHVVTITNLSPGTRYYYAFGTSSGGDLGGDTPAHFFDTAPAVGSPTRFRAWIVGDSGSGSTNQAAVRDAMLAHTSGDRPDLYLHVGDIAYNSGTDSEFTNNHFAIYQSTFLNTPMWPAIGNHEASSSDSPSQTGPYYEGFVLPAAGESGGVASGTEAYYAFEYANVHFVVLDTADTSLAPGSAQLQWLQADLQSTLQEWIVVFFHHPPYTKGTHDSDSASDSGGRMVAARESVLPILEAAGVDLVLAGHSHIYERSYLLDGVYGYGSAPNFASPSFATLLADGHILDNGSGQPAADGAYVKPTGLLGHQGAVYVVAGHGGNSAGGAGNHPVMYFSEAQFGSCLLTVNGASLTLENVRRDGVVSDSFTLVKQSTSCTSGAQCSDGDACTEDLCVNNTCQNPPVTCGGSQSCDPGTGQCVDPPITVTFQGSVGGYTQMTDSYLMESNPNTAFGAQPDMEFDGDDPGGTGQENLLLIRAGGLFDTEGGPIPQGAQIVSASLELVVFNSGSPGSVREARVTWDGNTTFNTFGGDPGADSTEYGPQVASFPGSTGLMSADVTASLAAWSADPAANLGWIILPTGTDGVQVRTQEYATASERPRVRVTYRSSGSGTPDAGVPADSGVDAGSPQDSGVTLDAGQPADSGVAPDAGQPADSGVTPDGGSSGQPTTVTFQAPLAGYAGLVDTTLRQASPASASGFASFAEVGADVPAGSGQTAAALVKMGALFDTEGGPIPQGAQITSAILTLTNFNFGNPGDVREVLVDWDNTVTWNTFGGTPGLDASDYGPSVGTHLGNNGPRDVDVTASLAAWSLDPTGNRGWIILPTGTNNFTFRTLEYGDPAAHPSLTVTYVAGAAPPPGPTTVVLQDGLSGYTSTEDTFLAQSAPTTVMGANPDAEWDADDPSGTGQANLLLLRFGAIFDLEGGPVPLGSTILSATLEYSVFDAGSDGALQEVWVPWDEATTWDTFGGTPGAEPSEYGPQVGSTSGALGLQVVDVTASVAAWSLDPALNRGWLVFPTGTNGAQIRSREYGAAPSERPRLVITYQ